MSADLSPSMVEPQQLFNGYNQLGEGKIKKVKAVETQNRAVKICQTLVQSCKNGLKITQKCKQPNSKSSVAEIFVWIVVYNSGVELSCSDSSKYIN